MLASKEAYAEEALRFKASGWTAYKIHPPTDPATDIKVCEAVRRAVGDDYTVMLDSTWAYQYPEALRVGKAVEALGLPLVRGPAGRRRPLQLREAQAAAGDPDPGHRVRARAASPRWRRGSPTQATDYLRGDVAVKGGITPLVKSAHLAEGFHMNFEIHHGGNSLNNVANLHVIMAIRNCEFFEVLLPAGAQKYGLAQDIELGRAGSRARAHRARASAPPSTSTSSVGRPPPS